MKILLTMSRFEPNINPPLGIAYVAAALRKEGFDVEILDPSFDGKQYAIDRIKKADYDIIGFSCFTMNYNVSRELSELAKKVNKNVLRVFGGPHVIVVPEESITDKEVDVICLGEGETTFVELAKALRDKKPLESVSGIWFKKEGQIVKNPVRSMICKLDELPFPARDLLKMDKYLNAKLGRAAWAVKQPSTTVMVGRGCPFNCTYCSTKLIFGKSVRLRSSENVVDEIEQLIKDYGIRGIAFIDDTFTINKKVVQAICEELIRRKINIEWACNSRIDTISPELLKIMKKAGCVYITFGVESGNQEVLDKFIKKGIRLEKVKDVFRWTKQAGINIGAYFLLGIPGETLENMQETIDFAIKVNPDVVNFNMVRPMPKTEMYYLAKKYGKVTAKGWDDFNFDAKPIFESKDWTSKQVEEMYHNAYRAFYFRPSFMAKQFFSIRNADDIKSIYHGLLMILKQAFVKRIPGSKKKDGGKK